jgi:Ca2+-binding RTX toxin-like protein
MTFLQRAVARREHAAMPQTVVIETPESGQTRVTFTSAEVGNGNSNDSGTMANQDGGLAVRVQAEGSGDTLTGPVSRYTDEDVVFVYEGGAGTFDVRDLVSGTQRGNQFATVQLGTAGNDLLGSSEEDRPTYINAGLGEDVVVGGEANDFLVGGGGNDRLAGNLGDDGILGGGGDDVAVLNVSTDGTDRIDLGAGADRIEVGRATSGQVRLSFTSAEVGNGSVNDGGTLTNQDGGLAVRIQSENGADGLTGPVSRADDEGITFVAAEGVTFDVRDLVSGVQRGDLFRTATLGTETGETLTGTGEADYINAGQGDDSVIGAAGDDFLVGGAGNDTLDGGTGADGLLGGGGDDAYLVDNARDRVIEAASGGTDRVFASTSYALAAGQEIEGLQLLAATTGDFDLTGNEFANSLVGNNSANVLNGGAGADRLNGRGGNDTYIVDNAGDQVFEAAGGGSDTVLASTSYALAAGQEIEGLQLLSATTGNFDLTGNAFSNSLVGNNSANVLNGGAGADRLNGRGGNDTYIVDNAGDQVIEASGGGSDTVLARTSYALAAGQEIEALQLLVSTGDQTFSLTGNAFANSLVGNIGDNVLDGGAGSDRLTGRDGDDTFVFSTAIGSGNVDTIADFSGGDTIRLSASVFTALTAGDLDADAFKDVGAGGTIDASDRIVYDSSTGALSYDADGSGAGAAVQFATLENRASLNAGDFIVA